MPKASAFKIGDIVKLKSGGPKMTVSQLLHGIDATVQCQWFSGSKHQEARFPEGSLEPAKVDEKP